MTGGPVEEYLARLRAGLRTTPARTAEIVAEAEDHLRESAAAGRAAGLGDAAAERAAVAAFGPVRQIVRAHRPTPAAYAAAAGMRAWPLFGCYLLLSALIGGYFMAQEIMVFHLVAVPVTRHGVTFVAVGTPNPAQMAAALGGCALAGLIVVAGFLAVRRRRLALVPLPPGLFPLAAGIALLVLAVVQEYSARSYGLGWLPRVSGLYELTSDGGEAAAALLGACCVLRALVILAETAIWPREPAAVGLGAMLSGHPLAGATLVPEQPLFLEQSLIPEQSLVPEDTLLAEDTLLFGAARAARRAGLAPMRAGTASGPAVGGRLARAFGYAAEGSLQAAQWLGSFLVISALIAGVLLYRGGWFESRYVPAWEAGCAGGGLAGVLLFAVAIRARRRRAAHGTRVTLPRWLTLRATVALLAGIAAAEYWIIASNANGRLVIAASAYPGWQCLYWVAVGAEFAAMLMGAACVARWVLAGLARRREGCTARRHRSCRQLTGTDIG